MAGLRAHPERGFCTSRDLAERRAPGMGAEAAGTARLAWRVKAQLALAQGDPALALQIVDRLIERPRTARRRAKKRWRRWQNCAARRWRGCGAMKKPKSSCAQPSTWRRSKSGSRCSGASRPAWGRLYLAQKRGDQAREVSLSARGVIERLAEQVPERLRENFVRRAMAEIPPAYRPSPRHPSAKAGRPDRARAGGSRVDRRGKTNREIAAELFVGVRTVEAHITRILTRLGFSSRTEIALWAVARGMTTAAQNLEKQ